ncbi:Pycsar system effector family protein [Nocardia sp. NPDC050175]|uniref:Pycsar system effector family protein n=1 Tax=Nocardia sp. NPDC050175 TaxID=3364317 RepID=UPI003799376A
MLLLIKHAETKAIATLAAAGVLGQILFVVVQPRAGEVIVVVLVVACVSALFVVGSGICAACVLWPRLKSGDAPLNLLYFGGFAADRGITRDRYIRAISELSWRPDDFIEQLAEQVWVNAEVARRKYRFANLAVGCLLIALPGLALTAFLSVLLGRA